MRSLRLLAAAALVLVGLGACGRTPTPPSVAPPTSTAGPTTAVPSAPPTTAPPTSAPPTSPRPSPTTTVKPTVRPSSSPPFPSGLAGREITRVPTSRKVVALTFDAGANADGVASILATLAREHVTATFFLTGDFVSDFPGAARNIVQAGHRVGNHSVTHPHFTDLSDAQIRSQLSQATQTIRSATGADPRPLFRFPYADRNARTIATVNAAGYVPIAWTVDTLGWQGTKDGTRGASFVTARVLNAATPGEIVLMHVGSNPSDHSTLDAAALPDIISGLRQRGYTFVTLQVLL